jgi:hypothetical protein
MAYTLFPVFDVPEIEEQEESEERAYKKSVYFDFDKGDFRLDGAHNMTEANGYEAYMQWCRKVVVTERDQFLAYSTDIGTELEEALQNTDRDIIESAIEDTITEAIMVNSHTEYVNNFSFTWGSDSLTVDFTVKGKEWDETDMSVTYST